LRMSASPATSISGRIEGKNRKLNKLFFFVQSLFTSLPCTAPSPTASQGDQMRLWKNRTKCSTTYFRQIQHITFLLEKSSQHFWAIYVVQKTVQMELEAMSDRRKFAQSCHSVSSAKSLKNKNISFFSLSSKTVRSQTARLCMFER
jgi:hypothetical protein